MPRSREVTVRRSAVATSGSAASMARTDSNGRRRTSHSVHRVDRCHPAAPLEGRDLALDRAGPDPGQGHLRLARLLPDLQLPADHDEQLLGGVTLTDERLARPEVNGLGLRGQALERLVGNLGEERRGPKLAEAPRRSPRASQRGEVLVDELDGHRALPHRAGDALHRSGPDVTGGEHPGQARLEEVRVAVEGPAGRAPAVAHDGGSGRDEPRLVADHVRAAIGAWLLADEHEQGRQRERLGGRLAVPVVQVRVALARWPSPCRR